MEYIASFGKRLVRLNVSHTHLEVVSPAAIYYAIYYAQFNLLRRLIYYTQ